MGIDVELKGTNGTTAVKRAKGISDRISKGVGFLMKKNNIEVIEGYAKLKSATNVEVKSAKGHTDTVNAKKIIIATGAHYRTFPGLEHDNDRLIGAWEAIHMEEMPKSIGIIGAGAIGVEFAYFWNAFGVDVHIFELQKHLLPIEDEDSSKEIEKAYKKYGIKMSLGIEKISADNKGDHVEFSVVENGEQKTYSFEKGLIAVGMTGNINGIGLEEVGVATDRGFVSVDENYQTNVPGVYAIGDVAGAPLLAHAASHEGVVAAEHLSGGHPHPIDKMNIPGCTYCQPQVASVGYTERALKSKELSIKLESFHLLLTEKQLLVTKKKVLLKP